MKKTKIVNASVKPVAEEPVNEQLEMEIEEKPKAIVRSLEPDWVRIKCSLNLRMAPDVNAPVVKVLPAQVVRRVEQDLGEWLCVEGGYCMKKFTEDVNELKG